MNRQEAVSVLQSFIDETQDRPMFGPFSTVREAMVVLVDSLNGPLNPAQFQAFRWASDVLDDEIAYNMPLGDAGTDAVIYEAKQLSRQLRARVESTFELLEREARLQHQNEEYFPD